MEKRGGAPLRWPNKRQDTNLHKALSKLVEYRRKQSSAVESEFRNSGAESEAIKGRMQEIKVTAEKELDAEIDVVERYGINLTIVTTESELADLEGRKSLVPRESVQKVRGDSKKGDKKFEEVGEE